MTRCLIALGSNVGDRAEVLDGAVVAIEALPRTGLIAASDWGATAPIGGPGNQGDFLNGAALIETSLQVAPLLQALHRIESESGRERRERWAARTLDLDLLLYGQEVADAPGFTVPHPRMSFRPFVLEPACEIAATMRHPLLGATLGELKQRLAQGADSVRPAAGPAVRAIVESVLSETPGVTLDAQSKTSKLQILLQGAEATPGMPALWLTSAKPEVVRQEIAAAVECVWPGRG